MTEVFVDGKRLRVDPRRAIGKGGEADVYDVGGRALKLAFVTFAKQTSDKEEKDLEPRRSTQHNPTPRRKRSRSPAPRTTSKRRYTRGSTSGCPACDRQHRLGDC